MSGELSSRGHEPSPLAASQTHDIMVEIAGPGTLPLPLPLFFFFNTITAVTDIHHSFVQRWNEAKGHQGALGSWPNLVCAKDMLFPLSLVPRTSPAGNSKLQVFIFSFYLLPLSL